MKETCHHDKSCIFQTQCKESSRSAVMQRPLQCRQKLRLNGCGLFFKLLILLELSIHCHWANYIWPVTPPTHTVSVTPKAKAK